MKKLNKLIVLMFILFLTACSSSTPNGDTMMATTTSLNDSGLLDALKPEFEKSKGVDLKWTSVGSGEAIKLAREGEAALLLAHSPADEKKLVDDGVSLGRTEIMYNNFLFVGPKKLQATNLKDAVKEICDSKSYISRADDSGTHKMEISLFKEYCNGKNPTNYTEANDGMAATLQLASEKKGYTLVDYATWLEQQDKLDLVEGYYNKKDLVNTYSIHLIKHESLSEEEVNNAVAFKEWLLSSEGLEIIKNYGIDKFNKPVFTLVDGLE
ncbi:substrate-binding domain-containing protein [Mycoplasma sp. P36-A1]|uniref:substrate-binding domain-containing protein n=1 Tax=Mycoplasma sp. P36-A1 TaxID=3252900 RepID=UPI003C2DB218